MKGVHLARRLARGVGLHALAWKLRKLDFPIHRSDLVLDAGSGAAPNPYANVVVDYDPSGRETLIGEARAEGKTLVWADVQRLPFRDNIFDYALCFHVIEHVADPRAALCELQRVAKAGYIETPNEMFDFVVPYQDHRNRVSYDGECLRIFRKLRWNVDRFEERFGRRRVEQVLAMYRRNPAGLHVQCYWEGEIAYLIGDEVIDDGAMETERPSRNQAPHAARLNGLTARLLRRRTLSDAELLGLLRCLECGTDELALRADHMLCLSCGRRYRRVKGHLDFRPL
jgi:SAM-dependent methyltransferase